MTVLAGVAGILLLVVVTASGNRAMALGLASIGFTLFRWETRFHGWPIVLVLVVALLVVRPNGLVRPQVRNRIGELCFLLAATAGFSLVWSPVIDSGVTAIGSWLALAGFVAVSRYAVDYRGHVRGLALGALFPMLALALTVVAFRLSPALEARYYASRVSHLFLGDAGNALYTGNVLTSNNSVELDRAAGFLFVNVNRASMVLGVAFLVLFAVGRIYKLRGVVFGSLLIAASIPFTGSKSGLALLIAVLVALVAARIARAQKGPARGLVNLVTLGAAVYGVRAVFTSDTTFVQESQETLIPREAIWSEAVSAIHENPFYGLGFGGWEQRWTAGIVRVPFADAVRPAHDWFLQAWLDGGLLYVAANLLYVALVLALLVKAYRYAMAGGGMARLALGLAPLWAVIHGLGDNTPTYGDLAALPLLGLAFALLMEKPKTAEELADLEAARAVVPTPRVNGGVWSYSG